MLGAAEAGFFPGIILYLTWWFPEQERTRALALFLTAISVAYVAGGPISGGLLELDGFLGLDGWQWLFLCEGLPAIGLGIFTLRFLDEGPEEAEWLEPEERDFLVRELARERALMEEAPGAGRRRRGARQRPGLAARAHLLHPAGGRLRPHLLRAGPGAGPHRLQRLRGGRARGGAVRDRHGGHARGGPARRARTPAASPTSPGSRCSARSAPFSRRTPSRRCCSRSASRSRRPGSSGPSRSSGRCPRRS